MAEDFDLYNAPQFVDFNQDCVDESVDSFFDVRDEDSVNKDKSKHLKESIYFSPEKGTDSSSHINGNDPLDTPCEIPDNFPQENSFDAPVGPSQPRRSRSAGNLQVLKDPNHESISENLEKIHLDHIIDNKRITPYGHGRGGSVSRFQQGSQAHLNKLAQPKRYASAENLHKKNNAKFVSLAEAVIKFQNQTPERFKSKPSIVPHQAYHSERTVPESPFLQTKIRSRPTHILSQEQREIMEFENQQKFKIKAHPVNKKILQGPLKPMVPVEKKAATVPKPFNLTNLPPKKTLPSPKPYKFHARPIQRCESVKMPEVEKRKPTKPVTPTCMKNYKPPIHKSMEKLNKDPAPSNHGKIQHRMTRVEPFSFEGRDQMIQKRKEQLIKRVLEEEKKAREFHAQPVPKALYKKDDQGSVSGSSLGSNKRCASTENVTVQFKARPATVLYKEPFVPVRGIHPGTDLEPFQLSTEHRALERAEYEKLQQEREEKLELYRKLEEERRLKEEQEEIAMYRKKAEHKAQPVRKYKELHIQPSGKVTEPISPRFLSRNLKKSQNKENVAINNISSD